MENQIISLVDDFINTMIELHNSDPGQEQELYEMAENQLLELTDKALLLLGGREEYLEAMLNQLIAQKLPQGAVIESFGNFKEELEQVVTRALEVYQEKQEMALSSEDTFGSGHVGDDPRVEETGTEVLEKIEESEADIEVSIPDQELVPDAEPIEETTLSEQGPDHEQEAIEKTDLVTDEEIKSKDPLGFLVSMVFPGEEVVEDYEFADMMFEYFLPQRGLAFMSAGNQTTTSHIRELSLRRSGIYVVHVDPEQISNIKSFKRQLRRILSQKISDDKRVFDFSAE